MNFGTDIPIYILNSKGCIEMGYKDVKIRSKFSMIIFTILINSDIDVLFSISNTRWGVLVSEYLFQSLFEILSSTKKSFRDVMEWFSVILISSAFSSVPELDSRRRNPLASSWHNDSLTKVSRKRFQNHRKLILTHPF